MTLTCLCECHMKVNPCSNCIKIDCIMNQGHITWKSQLQVNSNV